MVKRDANDIFREQGPDGLRAMHDGAARYKPKRGNKDGHRAGPSTGHAMPIIFGIPAGDKHYPWLIDEMLPETGVVLFAGQRGMLKTFSLLDCGAAVMSGGTFAGRKVANPGSVLYFAAEAP